MRRRRQRQDAYATLGDGGGLEVLGLERILEFSAIVAKPTGDQSECFGTRRETGANVIVGLQPSIHNALGSR